LCCISNFQDNIKISLPRDFFTGFFPPLQPLITLEYVGLENLTSAFGFVTMVKGPAAIAGPPLAGSYLYNSKLILLYSFSLGIVYIM